MSGSLRDRRTAWALGLAAGFAIFFVFLFLTAMFHKPAIPFGTDLAALKALHGDQCERPQSLGWIIEPQNTLSNVAYALVGGLILMRGLSWAAIMLGANLVTLGLMSGFYHATLLGNPQTLDVVWVYAALLSLSYYAAYSYAQTPGFLNLKAWWIWIAVGVLWVVATVIIQINGRNLDGVLSMVTITAFAVAATFLAYLHRVFGPIGLLGWMINCLVALGIIALGFIIKKKLDWDSTIVFAALATVLILQLIPITALSPPPVPKAEASWGPFKRFGFRLGLQYVAIAVCFGLGIIFRLNDGYDETAGVVTEKWLCSDLSAFQPHAWWHILGAAALLLSYDILVQMNRFNSAGDRPVVFSERAPDET